MVIVVDEGKIAGGSNGLECGDAGRAVGNVAADMTDGCVAAPTALRQDEALLAGFPPSQGANCFHMCCVKLA